MMSVQIQERIFHMITYDLKDNESSDMFYLKLKKFSEDFLECIKPQTQNLVSMYADFIKKYCDEKPRSQGEYAIELLTLGMIINRYSGAAQRTSIIMVQFLRLLYRLRKMNLHVKKLTDPFRGFVAGVFLVPKIGASTVSDIFNLRFLRKLIYWLDATGEFNDEVKRIRIWEKFFTKLPDSQITSHLQSIQSVFFTFQIMAKDALGKYTEGVTHFLNHQYPSYRFREDEIFCGKSEVEYHLNMIGSEVINWGFKKEFLSMKKRTILLPGCMRANISKCAAIHNGLDITCTGCTPECNINRIVKFGKKNGFTVFIVPHTSSFTKWLKRFQNTDEYGVVAVACLLNIVIGGYQMRELNIPSQCVLLDYCGCKKHWHQKGIITDLNEHRLLKVIFEGA